MHNMSDFGRKFCINCSAELETPGVGNSEDNLNQTAFYTLNCSTRVRSPLSPPSAQLIPVHHALATIFNFDALEKVSRMNNLNEMEGEGSNPLKDFHSTASNVPICFVCYMVLSDLYKMYTEFMQLRKANSFLGSKLIELENHLQSSLPAHLRNENWNPGQGQGRTTINQDGGMKQCSVSSGTGNIASVMVTPELPLFLPHGHEIVPYHVPVNPNTKVKGHKSGGKLEAYSGIMDNTGVGSDGRRGREAFAGEHHSVFAQVCSAGEDYDDDDNDNDEDIEGFNGQKDLLMTGTGWSSNQGNRAEDLKVAVAVQGKKRGKTKRGFGNVQRSRIHANMDAGQQSNWMTARTCPCGGNHAPVHCEGTHCSHCNKDFKQKYSLRNHIRVVLKVDLFECQFPGCSYKSYRKHDFVKHVKGQKHSQI